MCRQKMEQEDACRVLAVGHKVIYMNVEAIINSIRVWHDLGTLLDGPARGQPVFDLQLGSGDVMNVKLDEIRLWHPKVSLAPRSKQP